MQDASRQHVTHKHMHPACASLLQGTRKRARTFKDRLGEPGAGKLEGEGGHACEQFELQRTTDNFNWRLRVLDRLIFHGTWNSMRTAAPHPATPSITWATGRAKVSVSHWLAKCALSIVPER
jgi:hypothetical protein